MSLSLLRRLMLAIVLAGAFHSANADEATKNPAQPAAAAERQESPKGVLRLLPADAVTQHSIDTSRGKLAYTATAGTLAFYDQSGEQSAAVFYTAYVARSGLANRPLTFPPSDRVFGRCRRAGFLPAARHLPSLPEWLQ